METGDTRSNSSVRAQKATFHVSNSSNPDLSIEGPVDNWVVCLYDADPNLASLAQTPASLMQISLSGN